MSFVKSLDSIPLNVPVKVVSVNSDFINCKRLAELGFTEGCEIIPVHMSPLGDPIAYCLRGTIIALRKEDAKNIKVRLREG